MIFPSINPMKKKGYVYNCHFWFLGWLIFHWYSMNIPLLSHYWCRISQMPWFLVQSWHRLGTGGLSKPNLRSSCRVGLWRRGDLTWFWGGASGWAKIPWNHPMKLGDDMDSIEIPDHLQWHFLSGLGMFFCCRWSRSISYESWDAICQHKQNQCRCIIPRNRTMAMGKWCYTMGVWDTLFSDKPLYQHVCFVTQYPTGKWILLATSRILFATKINRWLALKYQKRFKTPFTTYKNEPLRAMTRIGNKFVWARSKLSSPNFGMVVL